MLNLNEPLQRIVAEGAVKEAIKQGGGFTAVEVHNAICKPGAVKDETGQDRPEWVPSLVQVSEACETITAGRVDITVYDTKSEGRVYIVG